MDGKGFPGQGAHIRVEDLTLAYGAAVVLEGVSFAVARGDVFVIMGVNGSGKSTLLKCMVGLIPPAAGRVFYDEASFWDARPGERAGILEGIGILYQKNALWSSMTLAENVALPLREYTSLGAGEIRDVVSFKLSLVGLGGFGPYFPSELSGGMQKRAALARAMALDPGILFFDEPSSGLDPVSAGLLDTLILDLNESLKTTIVEISHDLDSIFAIGRHAIFLDPQARTVLAEGSPRELGESSRNPRLRAFLSRRGTRGDSAGQGRAY